MLWESSLGKFSFMGRQERQVDSRLFVERFDLLMHAGDTLQQEWVL
jgi:hypothetical protein